MHVSNFTRHAKVILDLNKQPLYYDKCWLIRNDQDLGNVFLEFSMRVRNFTVQVRVILDRNKQCLYYNKCWLIKNDQDLGNVFL